MNPARIRTIVVKEFLEVRQTLGTLVPVAIMAAVSIAIPLGLAVGIPWLTGEDLSSDADFRRAVGAATDLPAIRALGGHAGVQAFILQQFLLFFVLIPVTAAMSLAAYSIIGEKQNRTLEPLLATPLSTAELLIAKVFAAILPALAIEAAALAVYFAGIAWLAEPGVAGALLTVRTLLLVALVGPLAGLVGLQLAVLTSSRVNDPRSAQQIGVLVILPVVGVLVAQFAGVFWLTVPVMLTIAASLAVVWLGLLGLGVRLFDRESILTRWK